MAEFSALGTFMISTSMVYLSSKSSRGRLFGVHVQFTAHGMHPNAVAIARQGNRLRPVDHHEAIVLLVRQQLADVDVDVALRFAVSRVLSAMPQSSPHISRAFAIASPVARPLLRRHVRSCLAGCRESAAAPATGSACSGWHRAEEKLRIGGLALRLSAQRAFARFQRLRARDVAQAIPHVGVGWGEKKRQPRQDAHW